MPRPHTNIVSVCVQQGHTYIRTTNKDVSSTLYHGRYAFFGRPNVDTALFRAPESKRGPRPTPHQHSSNPAQFARARLAIMFGFPQTPWCLGPCHNYAEGGEDESAGCAVSAAPPRPAEPTTPSRRDDDLRDARGRPLRPSGPRREIETISNNNCSVIKRNYSAFPHGVRRRKKGDQ